MKCSSGGGWGGVAADACAPVTGAASRAQTDSSGIKVLAAVWVLIGSPRIKESK
jgi:hypothetical protein